MRVFAPHVVRTKTIPPPRRARTLARPRVTQRLLQAHDYRLTILQAGAGYGKSTALAELAADAAPLIWCQVSDEDGDPLVLLLHICYATQHVFPAVVDLPIALIEGWDGDQGPLPWRGVLDQMINALSSGLTAPALLVIDDAHQIIANGDIPFLLDRLIALAPAQLHVLLAGRPTLTLPSLARWRARGEVLLLDQSTLTFNCVEIMALFTEHYNVTLTPVAADALLAYTEGWAIALQLIWQSLRTQAQPAFDIPQRWQTASLDALIDLLAQEVFAGQAATVQQFLVVTSTLRDLTPPACAVLCRADGCASDDAAAMLTYLRRQELFVVETAEGVLRYHHIFHTFLRRQSTAGQREAWHRRAATYFVDLGDQEAAIYHLLEAPLRRTCWLRAGSTRWPPTSMRSRRKRCICIQSSCLCWANWPACTAASRKRLAGTNRRRKSGAHVAGRTA
jgi:ATP/maltotriose-dependent transcriptional regulator MalT